MGFIDYMWIPVLIVLVFAVIYLALTTGRAAVGRRNSFYNSGCKYTMKKLWARYKLYRWKKKRNSNKVIIIENELEDPKIINVAENFDSQTFWGVNSDGSSILISFKRKLNRIAEVSLILTLNDGSVYRLPNQPDTMIFDASSQTWNAGDLKLMLLEPFTRWRLIYNGIMAKDSTLHHVRINLIWIAAADPFRIPDDQSNVLLAESLAFKSCSDSKWMDGITKRSINGYEQYGMIIGIVSLPDADQPIKLALSGIRERRWGLEKSCFIECSIIIKGMASDGTFYNIEVEKNSVDSVQYQFGCVRMPNGDVTAIDWTDINITKMGAYKTNIPFLQIKFSAGNREFTSELYLEHSKSNLLRGGRPWNWESLFIPTSIDINGFKGSGIIEFSQKLNANSEPINISEIKLLQWTNVELNTSNKICVSFNENEAACPQFVGAKCASLALLSTVDTNEYKVPNGFCLTINALKQQLNHNKILLDSIDNIIIINADPDADKLKKSCSTTTELFKNTIICDIVKAEIKKYFDELSKSQDNVDMYLAVRSSGIGEDSEELSAAGQNATILGCKTLDDVYRGVQECWASLFTYQSVEYRRQHGQHVNCGMGVVVQKMIDSRAAGVMFTRHPTTGDPSCILITSNYGLGETVVSGKVDPDTIYIQRDLQNNLSINKIEIGKKTHKMSLNKTENDLVGRMKISIVEDESKKSSLTDEECLKLGSIAIEQESLWGSPRDIEWTISEGVIYLVQARPITSLQSWHECELLHEFDTAVMSEDDISTFANAGEVLPEPASPLSGTTFGKLLNNSLTLASGTDPPKFYLYAITCSHYRVGLNVTNTFIKTMEDKITIANNISDIAIYGHIVTDEKFHSIAMHRHGAVGFVGKTKLFLKFLGFLFSKRKHAKKATTNAKKYNIDLNNCKTSMEMYKTINKYLPLLTPTTVLHSNTTAASIFSQILFLSVLLEGKEEYTTENYTDIGNVLSSCTNVLTADIPTSLINIVKSIKEVNKDEEFIKQPPENGIKWLQNNSPKSHELLQEFLKRHGHRGISEFDYMTDTWGLDPLILITTLQTTLSAPINYEMKSIETDLISNLVSPVRNITKTLLKFTIPLCQNAVACREETKAAIILIVHKQRLAYRQLAAQMMKEWLLPDLKLLFFLTNTELGKYLETRDPGYINKATLRRRYFPSWKKLKFAEINFGFTKPLNTDIDSNMFTSLDNITVKGTPVCSGVITGRACVVQNLSEIGQLKSGDILIAHSTDIGWSPYFPILGGVVTELGGLISHGAVVAREYGLPCIVGAQSATLMFQTGDTILLNATNGFITKVE